MQNINYDVPMTANDTFVFPKLNSTRRRILELHGTFGSATATIGYMDPSGVFVAFKKVDGTTAITTQASDGWSVETPRSGQFAVLIAGASGTSVRLTVSESA